MPLNADAHRRSAALLFEKSEDQVTPMERRTAKYLNVFFAHDITAYSVRKLSELDEISHEEALELVRKFKQKVLGVTEVERV